MGILHISNHSNPISLENFTLLNLLGEGQFGSVYKSIHNQSKQIYAIKEIPKQNIITNSGESLDQSERNILPQIYSPFIANLYYAFQTSSSLFLVMDYLESGDLRSYMNKNPLIEEKTCKFIISCVIQAFTSLHSKGIIHHDVKPENFVFDSKGFLCLTDFGISQKLSSRMKINKSGTLWYLAPEILYGQPYNLTSDYFSLGVIMFEIMEGRRPFSGNSRDDLMDSYIKEKLVIRNPYRYSNDAVDFVMKILIKNSAKRLGCEGIKELINHPWMKDVDWKNLAVKNIKSPCLGLLEQGRIVVRKKHKSAIIFNSPKAFKHVSGFYYNRFA
ncbi:hypothetical protein SteCoe_34873 [Stentor coeruleus]|uniref:non-specific serine/threonine protein kinase n=1 Tax=Stentor coeruleus TaxID=5963 RepID=A0A1R2ATP9_9CILI|nr:hypothetical protein SteCoe_34873 [Stentor coeruleus]